VLAAKPLVVHRGIWPNLNRSAHLTTVSRLELADEGVNTTYEEGQQSENGNARVHNGRQISAASLIFTVHGSSAFSCSSDSITIKPVLCAAATVGAPGITEDHRKPV
jgi:hypothetical protein